jgi:hypothetical protein
VGAGANQAIGKSKMVCCGGVLAVMKEGKPCGPALIEPNSCHQKWLSQKMGTPAGPADVHSEAQSPRVQLII